MLEEEGIDADHTARTLDVESVRAADYVFCVSCNVLDEVLRRSGPAQNVHLFCQFAGLGRRDIPDPVGYVETKEVFALLKDACNRIMRKVLNQDN